MPALRPSLHTFALIALLAACKDRAQDDCERALTRIARIDARSNPSQPAVVSNDALQQCRRNPNAMSDPVLRCALDSESDGAAAVCIDNFTRAVLKPSPDGGGGSGGLSGSGGSGGSGGLSGSGLNPLLSR